MSKKLTHASFFSGVGGLDLGFEKAGIETVSLSEIDPFARSVLATRFPDVPQLGDIVALANYELSGVVQQPTNSLQRRGGPVDAISGATSSMDWREADIWSGGFPCQDLSVAGKRKGFDDGKRSVLAFTFLNLVERYRPRWIVLENVPGLLTSNNGRDLNRLLREMDELGYGVSWRTLDARYFGVPQRRRRVFLVASLGSDRSAEVLFECEGGCGHTQESKPSWAQTPRSSEQSPHIIGTLVAGLEKRTGTTQDKLYVGYGERVGNPKVAGALLARYAKGVTSTVEDGQLVVGPEVDTSRMRTTDGLAGGMDDSGFAALGAASIAEKEVSVEQNTYSIREDAKAGNFSATPIDTALSLNAVWPSPQSHHAQTFIATAFRKSRRAQSNTDYETWVDDGIANTLNLFDASDSRTTHAVVGTTQQEQDSVMLPEGMDSNRYRVCGNGVVANVAEWVGLRIKQVDEKYEGQ